MIDNKDEDLMNLPFFAWQCITIQLDRRDIDFVIPDEGNMIDLLTLLIFNINTIDGTRDSADSFKYIIAKNRIYTGVALPKPKAGIIPKLTKVESMKLVKSTLLKYKLLKFRIKLSFMAFKKCMTIGEMILKQIKASYDYFISIGHIKNNISSGNEILFNQLLDGDAKMMFVNVMKMNLNKVKYNENEKDYFMNISSKINYGIANMILSNKP